MGLFHVKRVLINWIVHLTSTYTDTERDLNLVCVCGYCGLLLLSLSLSSSSFIVVYDNGGQSSQPKCFINIVINWRREQERDNSIRIWNYGVGFTIQNWNLIHTVPARNVQLLLRYVVIMCQFPIPVPVWLTFSLLFPKKDRNLRLNFWQTVDWITPDWIFHATAHAHRFTSRSLDKARLGLLTDPTGWKWSPQRICLPQMPSHTRTQSPKKKRKASEKEPENYRKSCTIVIIIIIIERSLIWPDKNTYTYVHVYTYTQCIVSSIHALSHSDDDTPIRISGRSLTVYSCRKLSGTLTTFMATL